MRCFSHRTNVEVHVLDERQVELLEKTSVLNRKVELILDKQTANTFLKEEDAEET